ncbi:MAG: type I-D CRISPR-associated protein Cas5/Csc1 [Snowella sp.]|jgi:CRISPR-associated protein Csc1|nr:MAG: type I-D CRISPR-associated protein Cas5/Csc1 [Snowella sp.]
MTNVYRCEIELHDSLYYATREIGRLYETEAILHNYSLCYALGLIKSDTYRYFCKEQIPQYEEHLTQLNEQQIYVTPARSLRHASILNTWKYANNNYHVEMTKTQKNIPSFGRAKEIAPESIFEFFVISQNALKLPKWIRLGKWMSKAEVKMEQTQVKIKTGNFSCTYPLNPLDVMFTNQVISYDVINMPPVSLIRNVSLNGEYYEGLNLPVNMAYRFS